PGAVRQPDTRRCRDDDRGAAVRRVGEHVGRTSPVPAGQLDGIGIRVMNRAATLRPQRAQGWIVGARPRRTRPAVRLFCLPWAGAAPQLPRSLPWVPDQPDSVVREKLRELGGVPAEVDESPELMELLMPVIRADFSVCETHRYRPEPPLHCPIVAFCGEQDREVPPAR